MLVETLPNTISQIPSIQTIERKGRKRNIMDVIYFISRDAHTSSNALFSRSASAIIIDMYKRTKWMDSWPPF